MTKQQYLKLTSLALIIGMPSMLHAAGKSRSHPISIWMMDNIILVLGILVVIGALITLWNLMDGMVAYQQKELLREKGIAITTNKPTPKDSIFKKLYDKAWSLIPIDNEADIDLGHDYDGIRELDNKLPPWWVWTFYITIFFGIGYLYVYHFSDIGQSQLEEYTSAMERGEEAKLAYLATQPNLVDESNVEALMDEKSLAVGHDLFIANCAACHGQKGEGTVGPNLTDKYWVHGGGIKNVFKTIKHGVPEKGMIAWKNQLKPTTMQKLASYILTLEGTNPPNQKAKEGELYEEEGES